ncbi:MAG: septum formation initiator family protein [Phoenicibacter congonensis]|uniref:Septum formation initiator family protein n=1 Tax=Phoenicibacter congonensis TaxID=1944646 RepID=A0AA43RM93_9ACTN|nr:septum formation initiator family protein [Phoenicibacter congonensis]
MKISANRNFDFQTILARATSLGRFPKTLLLTLTSIALVCVCCYQPAKVYYTQVRETQKSQAELVAVEARNAKLKAAVESLQTDEGVEDKAKSDYGYVKEGEGAVVVTGIEKKTNNNLPEYVDSKKIASPDTWYSGVLDSIFGYDNSISQE